MFALGREMSVDAPEQFRGLPGGLASRDGAAARRVDVGSVGSDRGDDEADRLVTDLLESVHRIFNDISMSRAGDVGDVLVSPWSLNDTWKFGLALRPDGDGDGNFRVVGADPSASDTGTHRMSGSSGDMRQQIGEILGTVRALDERMKDRQNEARVESDRTQAEIRNIKHELRQEQQITSLRLEKQEKETSSLAAQVDQVTTKMDEVSESVNALKGPVTELVNMKRRFVAFTVLGMSIMAVLWRLAEPLWAWVVHRVLGGSGPP